jgi:hypothetical protein
MKVVASYLLVFLSTYEASCCDTTITTLIVINEVASLSVD